jgi:hypothetical protein
MLHELLGKVPKQPDLNGKYSKKFFDRKGTLKHIEPLTQVLRQSRILAREVSLTFQWKVQTL